MSVSDVLFEQLRSLHVDVTETKADLSRRLSEYDRKVSAIYHELENDNFGVLGGYRYAKRLQDVLQKRRIVKHEMDRFSPILHMIADGFPTVEKGFKKRTRAVNRLRRVFKIKLTIDNI